MDITPDILKNHVVTIPETRTLEKARVGIDQAIDVAIKLLRSKMLQLPKVNVSPGTRNNLLGLYAGKIQELKYLKKQRFNELRKELNQPLPYQKLAAHELRIVSKKIKAIKKETIKIVQDVNSRALITVSQSIHGKRLTIQQFEKEVAHIKKKWRLKHSFTKEARKLLEQVHIPENLPIPTSDIESNVLAEITKDPLAATQKKAGAVGFQGVYLVGHALEKKKIKKQLQSINGQELSNKRRRSLVNRITLENGEVITSGMIPLNHHFDDIKRLGHVFKRIFGEKGVATTDAYERHLINGWESKLLNPQGKTVVRILRHAIMASRFEKDKKRRAETSSNMARELLTAAVLQELKQKGVRNLKHAKQQSDNTPFTINFSSVSIVTPSGKEKTYLEDQRRALEGFEGLQTIEIDGIPIKVNFNIMTFNYGVNAGAVGNYKGYPIPKFGLQVQHQMNKKALKKLAKLVQNYLDPQSKAPYNAKREVAKLWYDIWSLNRDKSAYLKGGKKLRNQYEVGAKILLLMNVMSNHPNTTSNQGFKCSGNCKSNKDRFTIMDAMLKTFATMGHLHGHIPTTKELKANKPLREKFVRILVQMLLKGGSLGITEVNTSIPGFKVRNEAQIWDMLGEDFADIRGLSLLVKG